MDWSKKERFKKPRKGTLLDDEGNATPLKAKKGARTFPDGARARYCTDKATVVRHKDGTTTRTGAARGRGVCDVTPMADRASPAAGPASAYTSSAFTPAAFKFKTDKKTKVTSNAVCAGGGKRDRCSAQIGMSKGRRVLRFCVGAGQPGHVQDITGMSPAEVRKLSLEACAAWRKSGSYAGTEVGKAALGGVRRTKAAKRRKTSKRGRR